MVTRPQRATATALTAMAALAVLAALAHLPSLSGPFLYDDWNDVARNPSALAGTFWQRLPETLRPLLKASYALQDAWHGPVPALYHAVNIALHAATTCLVFLVIRRALAGREGVALAAAALWALHPAGAETVSYISGRSMGLSVPLMLLSLLAVTAPGKPRTILAFACALSAALARETALILPALLLWWQMTLDAETPRRDRIARAAPVWSGAILAAGIILLMPRHGELVGFSTEVRPPLDAVRANLFAIPAMLAYWVEPWRLTVLPEQPLIYGWGDAPTWLRIAGFAIAAGLALFLRRRAPAAAFAIGWTLLCFMPSNSLIWRVDPVAIRPLYMAGIGLSILLALGLAAWPRGRTAGLGVAAVLALALAWMTHNRSALYADEVALWSDATAKTPDYARAHAQRGKALLTAGRNAEARAAIELALALAPFDIEAANTLRLIDALPSVDSHSSPP